MYKTILIFILFTGSTAVSGQTGSTGIKFDLSVRERFELWNGMNIKNYGDDSPGAPGNLNDRTLYQRVITGLTFKPAAKLTISFHMQDSRAFGWSLRNSLYPDLFKIRKAGTDTPYYTMNPNEEFFEIYDAYLEYNRVAKNLSVKLGRQKIFYGDTRIFGPGDWGNTGRWTWDALKVSYKKGENFIDLFAGGTIIHDPLRISIPFTRTEFWGGGMYAHINIPGIINIEPFYAFKTEGSANYISTLGFSRNWTGIRVYNNDFNHFVFDLTAVKEFGSESSKPINAYGLVAKAGFQFHAIPAKPLISIMETYASGGRKTDDKIYTFEPAYGANDRFYGRMNILSWSNLDDREITIEFFPVKDLWIELTYNRFYIPVPDDLKLLNTMKLESGKHHFGDEFDAFIRYQVLRHWQLTGVFGYFLPAQLTPINNEPAKNAAWFALQVLFTL
jgi:Alginate export